MVASSGRDATSPPASPPDGHDQDRNRLEESLRGREQEHLPVHSGALHHSTIVFREPLELEPRLLRDRRSFTATDLSPWKLYGSHHSIIMLNELTWSLP
jgi:hypothetical protein